MDGAALSLQGLRRGPSWTVPLNLALLLHLAVFVAGALAPSFMSRPEPEEEIYTIDLVSLPEPPGPAAEAPPPVPETAPEQAPAESPEAVRIAPVRIAPVRVEPVKIEPAAAKKAVAPAEEPPEAPPRLVSLKPVAVKVKKARDTRLADEVAAEEAKKRQAEEEARKQAEEKERQARRLAEEKRRADERRRAEERRREARKQLDELRGRLRGAASAGTGRGGSAAIQQQYALGLRNHLRSRWKLPSMQQWDPSLEVILRFTVLPDGRVRDLYIKKKSGNAFYDQFAKKAFEDAMPLPAFPPQLRKDHLVVELNFKPGSVM